VFLGFGEDLLFHVDDRLTDEGSGGAGVDLQEAVGDLQGFVGLIGEHCRARRGYRGAVRNWDGCEGLEEGLFRFGRIAEGHGLCNRGRRPGFVRREWTQGAQSGGGLKGFRGDPGGGRARRGRAGAGGYRVRVPGRVRIGGWPGGGCPVGRGAGRGGRESRVHRRDRWRRGTRPGSGIWGRSGPRRIWRGRRGWVCCVGATALYSRLILATRLSGFKRTARLKNLPASSS
jgi:hypothetical protein